MQQLIPLTVFYDLYFIVFLLSAFVGWRTGYKKMHGINNIKYWEILLSHFKSNFSFTEPFFTKFRIS